MVGSEEVGWEVDSAAAATAAERAEVGWEVVAMEVATAAESAGEDSGAVDVEVAKAGAKVEVVGVVEGLVAAMVVVGSAGGGLGVAAEEATAAEVGVAGTAGGVDSVATEEWMGTVGVVMDTVCRHTLDPEQGHPGTER